MKQFRSLVVLVTACCIGLPALAQTAPPALLLERLDAFVETVPSAATATRSSR